MVTAESKTENVIAARKAGVNNYIVKPFNAQTLKAKIEAVFPDAGSQRRALTSASAFTRKSRRPAAAGSYRLCSALSDQSRQSRRGCSLIAPFTCRGNPSGLKLRSSFFQLTGTFPSGEHNRRFALSRARRFGELCTQFPTACSRPERVWLAATAAVRPEYRTTFRKPEVTTLFLYDGSADPSNKTAPNSTYNATHGTKR